MNTEPIIQAGTFQTLTVIREKPMGVFLNDGEEGILLPKRFVPPGTKTGDELKVFLYHDNEGRLIATTQNPLGILGDIVKLKVVGISSIGAFLDWGLMKDLFIPKRNMINFMRLNGSYLVKIIMDEKTGRLAATEYIESYLSNDTLSVKELEEVMLTVYRRTEIGYEMIINNKHKSILHFNEIFRDIKIGDKFRGFIKKIFRKEEDTPYLIDVVAGQPGYKKVSVEEEKILSLLKENNGYLPYYDKSDPQKIYSFFGMSKKTFKMALGDLYKQRKIKLAKTGIQLLEE